jgi:hypothetical protein
VRRKLFSAATTIVVGASVVLLGGGQAQAGIGYFTTQDLTTFGAPLAVSALAGWSNSWDLSRHVAYVDAARDIVTATEAAGSTTWTWSAYHPTDMPDPTGERACVEPPDPTHLIPADCPPALTGYSYDWDHSDHLWYENTSGHLIELWQSTASPGWRPVDQTAALKLNSGLVVLHGFQAAGKQHVLWTQLGAVGQHDLTFTPGLGWADHGLDVEAGTGTKDNSDVPMAGSGGALTGPAGEFVATRTSQHKLALLTNYGTGWTTDVTTITPWIMSGFFDVPDALATATAGQQAVVFWFDANQNVHAYQWPSGVDQDVSTLTGHEGDSIDFRGETAFISRADGDEHFFYTIHNTVQEYERLSNGAWAHWLDVGGGVAQFSASAFEAPDNAGQSSFSEYLVYHLTGGDPIVETLTKPTVVRGS